MGVDKERLWQRLQALGRIGQTGEGGVTRLSFTREDQEAKAWVIEQMEAITLEHRSDSIGNVFGRLPGSNPELPAVLNGSHDDLAEAGQLWTSLLQELAYPA